MLARHLLALSAPMYHSDPRPDHLERAYHGAKSVKSQTPGFERRGSLALLAP
jgi:hypothetical protein